MANDINQVTIAGRLGSDPELRFSAGGAAYCTLNVASSRSYKRKGSDEWTEETAWVSVVSFGNLAEHVAASLNKGDKVVCSGRLTQRTWQADDGSNRSIIQISADDITPSLTWATAIVERVQRSKAGDNQPPGGQQPEPSYADMGMEGPF